MRSIGLDVHRDFCEVAIAEDGRVRSAARIATDPPTLELFGASLAPHDQVALEVTGCAWEIARILRRHVARVIVVSPNDLTTGQSRAKTDRLDARALARLLAAGSLDDVWVPDEATSVLRRRLSRRRQLVAERTRVKNEIHAILVRRLIGRPPVSDLFGVKGRRWLEQLDGLPIEERETLDSCLRQIAFLDDELARVERLIAQTALGDAQMRRLMTVPGVNVIVAATFLASVGDISRFRSPRNLTGFLGLDPKVRQSGAAAATHGHITKQGSRPARHALVEACWSVVRQPGPLRAFYQRVRARRGHQIAIVASARKLASLFWCLLTRGEDYAFAQPSLTAKKLRLLELSAGAPHATKPTGVFAANTAIRHAERALAEQAERAYARTVKDWQQSKGASATPGRASQGSSTGARRATDPRPKSAL